MKITNLTISHYKTVEKPLEINHFSNLHVLIGPNNSGKTNILDALALFFSPDLNPERFYDSKSDLQIIVEFSSKERLQINYQENQRTYLLNGTVVTGEEQKAQDTQKQTIRIKPEVLIRDLIHEELTEFRESYEDEYLDFCRTMSQYFDDVEISEKLFRDSIHSDRKERPIARMGEGFKRLFVMLFYVFNPRYHIILIDEPEIHLHPTLLKKFLRILMDKKLDNQIFLTTHSSVLVQPETIEHIWRVSRDKDRNTVISSMAQSNQSIPRARLFQELNADNTEMFFADKVLLVEGVSDRILMRGLLDKFHESRHDIKVIYTGGKGNLDTYVNLFQAFQISYLIMLDKDALSGTWSYPITRALKGNHRAPLKQKLEILKKNNIFILNGTLEKSYPRKYQKKDTKPLNALYAVQMITKADLNSSMMRVIKELIEKL